MIYNNMDIKEMARLGGKASAKKRFEGLTKEQISAKMRAVRYSKKQIKQTNVFGNEVLEAAKKIK